MKANNLLRNFSRIALLFSLFTVITPVFGITDDARQFAIEAGLEWLDAKDKPFTLRETWWSDNSSPGEVKLIRHQLFARNEYWFWAATETSDAKISIHIYNSNGDLVDNKAFEKDSTAGVLIIPKNTGVYYLRVVVEDAPGKDKRHWAVVYAYR